MPALPPPWLCLMVLPWDPLLPLGFSTRTWGALVPVEPRRGPSFHAPLRGGWGTRARPETGKRVHQGVKRFGGIYRS